MLYPSWGNCGDSEGVGFVAAATRGTQITSNVTPGNDGAWTQLIASTARQYNGFHVIIQTGNNVANNSIVEIGIGAGGAEQTLMSFPLQNQGANQRGNGWSIFVPLSIAGSTRIAARVRRSTGISAVYAVTIIGYQGPGRYLPPFHRITDYGVDLANAAGTSVDPGGVANTQSPYTQIVAATTNPIKALYVLCNRRDFAVVANNIAASIQVFIGPTAGTILTPEFPTWQINSTTDVAFSFGVVGPFFVNLPAGTELGVKVRNSGIVVGERESQVILWGLD